VDVGPVRTHPELATGLSVILSTGGERSILTSVAAIGALDPADVPDGLLARARHVHASSYYLMPKVAAGLPALFARARRLGATTSLDTNDDPSRRWLGRDDVLPVTDVFLPNRSEAVGLAGEPDPVTAARRLAALGPTVVVKDGEHGAFLVDPAGALLRSPAVGVDAVDTTGAGDSFDAGFLAARLRGLPPAECLALACRAGAASTRTAGGTAAQATADQVGLPPA
jgi:sugar/nucleoside kinase (ribokinase family)